MDRVQKKRFDLKLLFVTVLCLVGAAAGGVLLYRDLNVGGGAGRGKPMAKVERREAKVRRKAASSYIWSYAQSQEDLYRRDSIQTGIGSAAAIRMNDSTMLELGENSLVVIDDITNLSLNFVKGSLVLRTATGDSRVSVGKDGKTSIERLPIRLLKPDPLAILFSAERNREVQFAWEPRAEVAATALPPAFRVEFSKDKSFRAASTQRIPVTTAGARNAAASLAAGKYFWRLVSDSPDGKGGILTEVSQFRVTAATALKGTWPTADQKILTWEQDPTVQFRWLVPQNPETQDELTLAQVEHRLEIARDPQFSSVAVSQPVNALSGVATLNNVPLGAAYWRIKSRFGEQTVAGAPERFIHEKAQKLALELGKPSERASLELQPQIRFNWTCDSTNVEFEFQLEKGGGAAKVAASKGPALTYVWKEALPGAYRWRVRALWQEKAVVETPWREFSVFAGAPLALVTPAKDQQLYFWDAQKPKAFEFEWKKDSVAADESVSYQVEVARDAEFKNGFVAQKTRKTTLASETLKLAGGEYFWRVSIVDSAGRAIKSSDARKFAYGLHPVLAAPTAVKPEPGYVRNVVLDTGDVTLAWDEVEDAEVYEVTLFEPPAAPARALASDTGEPQGRVAFRVRTEKNSAAITEEQLKKIQPAGYQWTVRAIDRLQRKGQPLEPRPLAVTYGEPLAAPEILSPEVQ